MAMIKSSRASWSYEHKIFTDLSIEEAHIAGDKYKLAIETSKFRLCNFPFPAPAPDAHSSIPLILSFSRPSSISLSHFPSPAQVINPPSLSLSHRLSLPCALYLSTSFISLALSSADPPLLSLIPLSQSTSSLTLTTSKRAINDCNPQMGPIHDGVADFIPYTSTVSRPSFDDIQTTSTPEKTLISIALPLSPCLSKSPGEIPCLSKSPSLGHRVLKRWGFNSIKTLPASNLDSPLSGSRDSLSLRLLDPKLFILELLQGLQFLMYQTLLDMSTRVDNLLALQRWWARLILIRMLNTDSKINGTEHPLGKMPLGWPLDMVARFTGFDHLVGNYRDGVTFWQLTKMTKMELKTFCS
ncbi:hypothetical protein CKAN_01368300 [Cinnamomum micranthum f. kanehirae]|uniref:Uncharacterized protein n=1 Tax=Cinnamomum micranthum f. kanehirae TaxID=337451 RepID=A0A3S3MJH1_9MAGN|nr:hypothetical protein CKAN_01368300 [Cinnamomum micranthum f. kanehirae]